MKKLILALALAGCSFAASPTLLPKQPLSGYVHIKPQAMPTSLTVVAASDALVDMIVVIATGAQTVLVQDAQGTPIPIYPSFTTVAGTIYMASFPAGYYCPGGFAVQAGGAGISYYASWRQ